jgi:hypothetical protein
MIYIHLVKPYEGYFAKETSNIPNSEDPTTIRMNHISLKNMPIPDNIGDWSMFTYSMHLCGLAYRSLGQNIISKTFFDDIFVKMPIYIFLLGSYCEKCMFESLSSGRVDQLENKLQDIVNKTIKTKLDSYAPSHPMLYLTYDTHHSINADVKIYGSAKMGPGSIMAQHVCEHLVEQMLKRDASTRDETVESALKIIRACCPLSRKDFEELVFHRTIPKHPKDIVSLESVLFKESNLIYKQ